MKLSDSMAAICANIGIEPPRPDRPFPQPPATPVSNEPVRYLITSNRWSGPVEVIYSNQLLQQISLLETDMSAQHRLSIKSAVPIQEGGLEEMREKYPFMQLQRTSVEITFQLFYNAFGKKDKRLRAEAIWEKMSKAEQLSAFNYIPKFRQKKEKLGENMPNPDSYLKDRRWNDE